MCAEHVKQNGSTVPLNIQRAHKLHVKAHVSDYACEAGAKTTILTISADLKVSK